MAEETTEKLKSVEDFKRVLTPILTKLANDANAKGHPRRSANAKEILDMFQLLLKYANGRECQSESRRIELIRINAQLVVLQKIVGDVIIASPTDTAEGKVAEAWEAYRKCEEKGDADGN